MSVAERNGVANGDGELPWPELQQRVSRRILRRTLATLWPECEEDGGPLRWGAAAAYGHLPPAIDALSRIAAGRKPPRRFDFADAAERFIASIRRDSLATELLAEAVAWCYALPELAVSDRPWISERPWWTVLGELQALQRAASEQAAAESIERLIAAGEIGAVLSWRLPDLPSCDALRAASLEAIADWFDAGPYAVAGALSGGGRYARLGLASALRSRRLAARQNRRVGTRSGNAAEELATRVTALLRADGSAMLRELPRPASDGGRRSSARAGDDLTRSGLLNIAAFEAGEPALRTATEAVLGRTSSQNRMASKGRLAWKVDLPEPGWSDELAKLAVMLPDWDVRRGRVAVDYSGSATRLEISGGKRPLILGEWTAEVRQNGQPLRPTSGWSDVCWYSDDDVHYLELEQSFEGGAKIQRQIMLLREDECLMMADAVFGSDSGESLEYFSHLPLVATAEVQEERETRELTIVEGKPRAVLYPLGLNEWRMGPAPGTLRLTDAEAAGDSERTVAEESGGEPERGPQVELRVRGVGRLYAALWCDLDRKRIRRERTWRQLTVAENLRLLEPHEAAGYRIQAGDDQWLVYRSLSGQRNRTLLGKNLISDFFCGRFSAGDGFVEELIAVDEQAS